LQHGPREAHLRQQLQLSRRPHGAHKLWA
jgi:hypothetical protein